MGETINLVVRSFVRSFVRACVRFAEPIAAFVRDLGRGSAMIHPEFSSRYRARFGVNGFVSASR
jgi:hypothetical protein